MPGVATQFEILRLTIDKLAAAGDPNGYAAAMNAHPQYAHLGAIGPLIADFLPSDPTQDGQLPQDFTGVWRLTFHLVGRQDPPGLFHILRQINEVLDEIQPLADASDCDGLRDLADNGIEDRINDLMASFAGVLGAVQSGAVQIAGIIGTGLRPKVNTTSPSDPVPPPKDWGMRDFLHWKRTGQFVNALLQVANDTNDDRLKAYAIGYTVGYAGHAVGNGFINSIVRGPARTQWWRQRFVRNYVDAWVYGFYNQTPRPTAGDTPSPPYTDPAWQNLCSANLQQRIQLPGLDPIVLMDLAARNRPFPAVVDPTFSQHWFDALSATYGADLPPRISAASFNSAYIFMWLMLWFQTSGSILGCNEAPPMTPPGGCGDAPSELDPFVNGVPIDGSVPQPPDASIDYDIDEAAVICGIILAILGGLAFLGGGAVAGGILIGASVATLDCDNVVEIDYQKLRCLLFWERMFLHNTIRGVHRLLALAALEYPFAAELAVDSDFHDLFPLLEPWESGRQLCRSRVDQSFPGKPWDGSLVSFNQPPTDFETPRTMAYLTAAYPDFFIDDAAANPVTVTNDVKNDLPTGTAPDGGRVRLTDLANRPVQFGNAVDNAIDLLDNLGQAPNWNLDQDRGLAYLTWQFQNDRYDPNDVHVVPEV